MVDAETVDCGMQHRCSEPATTKLRVEVDAYLSGAEGGLNVEPTHPNWHYGAALFYHVGNVDATVTVRQTPGEPDIVVRSFDPRLGQRR